MPFVVKLKAKFFDIDKFLNIDLRVGDAPECANVSADVLVVQKLIALANSKVGPGSKVASPLPSGRIDAVTNYFIYHIQARQQKRSPSAKIDGIITPAIHSSNYGGGLWTIMILNNIAAFENRPGWELLLSQFPVRSAS
jgi:hypothetical protein